MVTQIFLIGSSSVYGVGANQAGWGDLVKQHFHQKMYSKDGVGEKYEVFNFGFSGATLDFINATVPNLLKFYKRPDSKTIIVFAVGGNNAKAIGSPDNFISSPEEFKTESNKTLNLLSKSVDYLITLGGYPYDEKKVYPKPSPFTGKLSYFSNQRRTKFEKTFREVCEGKNIPFLKLDVSDDDWIKHYLYQDGLHPNQEGYGLIAKLVIAKLEALIN